VNNIRHNQEDYQEHICSMRVIKQLSKLQKHMVRRTRDPSMEEAWWDPLKVHWILLARILLIVMVRIDLEEDPMLKEVLVRRAVMLNNMNLGCYLSIWILLPYLQLLIII